MLLPEPMVHVFTANSCMPKDNHYVTIFMLGRAPKEARPVNTEPDKCYGWEFRSWDELRASGDAKFMPFEALLLSSANPAWLKSSRALMAREKLLTAALVVLVFGLVFRVKRV